MAFGNNSAGWNLLKVFYSKDYVTNFFSKYRFLTMLGRDENVQGEYFDHPITYGGGQSTSGDFSRAQTQAGLTGDLSARYHVTLRSHHHVATISAELLKQARTNEKAFLKASTGIIDNAMKVFGGAISKSVFRDGSGALGRISAGTNLSSSTLSFANPKDAYLMEVGMGLELSADLATVKAKGSNGTPLFVKAVNKPGGSITIGRLPSPSATSDEIDDAVYGVPTAAAGDYVIQAGSLNTLPTGLAGWRPATVASNDSFYNVNRSYAEQQLSGTVMDGTGFGGSISTTMMEGLELLELVGGEIDTFWVHPSVWTKLATELDDKAIVDIIRPVAAIPQIGYQALRLVAGGNDVKVMSDAHCQSDIIWGCKQDELTLVSVDPVPDLWDEDSLKGMRATNAAGLEWRFMAFANMVVENPLNLLRIAI